MRYIIVLLLVCCFTIISADEINKQKDYRLKYTLAGGGIGLVGGGATGWVIGALSYQGDWWPMWAFAGAIYGGGLGLITGSTIGYFKGKSKNKQHAQVYNRLQLYITYNKQCRYKLTPMLVYNY